MYKLHTTMQHVQKSNTPYHAVPMHTLSQHIQCATCVQHQACCIKEQEGKSSKTVKGLGLLVLFVTSACRHAWSPRQQTLLNQANLAHYHSRPLAMGGIKAVYCAPQCFKDTRELLDTLKSIKLPAGTTMRVCGCVMQTGKRQSSLMSCQPTCGGRWRGTSWRRSLSSLTSSGPSAFTAVCLHDVTSMSLERKRLQKSSSTLTSVITAVHLHNATNMSSERIFLYSPTS